jgi:hypothetical protein
MPGEEVRGAMIVSMPGVEDGETEIEMEFVRLSESITVTTQTRDGKVPIGAW